MSKIRLSEKIGPAFYDVAHDVFLHGHTHYDFSGGRGSLFQSTRPVRGGTAIMHKIYPMHSCAIHNTTCS